MPSAAVHRLPAGAPDDVSAVERAFAEGGIDPRSVVAVLGKTEGNGCVNDFTRAYAAAEFRRLLGKHLGEAAAGAVCLVMSGGTEGALAPHWLVLERREGGRGSSPSLALGRARTAPLLPEALGRRAQAMMVAEGVRAAMDEAEIDDPADVHFVQVKVPLLTAARIATAGARGAEVTTRDTLKSMGLSRGAAALGVGVALSEIGPEAVTDEVIGRDTSLWSGRASTSAGVELEGHEVVVMGMSRRWAGPLAIDHAVMADQVDVEPVRAALARLGLDARGHQLDADQRRRLVALLAKADPGTGGSLRGRRHTKLDDSDIPATRHARAFVGGALAGLVGHAELFVSGGAEHQGPDGGGPVAVIVDRGA